MSTLTGGDPPSSRWPFPQWIKVTYYWIRSEREAREFPRIPRALYCTCNHEATKGNFEGYFQLAYRQRNRFDLYQYRKMIPFGNYCLTCRLPHIYSYKHALRNCESCGVSYVIEGRQEQVPHRFNICPECSAKLPTRRRVKRTPPPAG